MHRTTRSQTEPIAGLIAVAAVAVGISFYAVYIGGVLPGSSADAVEEPTVEAVWNDISEQGVYRSTDNPWNNDGDSDYTDTDNPLDHIAEPSLPRGTKVYVEVTTVDQNVQEVTLARAVYDESGEQVSVGPDIPPAGGHAITRPIPVRVRSGDVTAGTLRVVTW